MGHESTHSGALRFLKRPYSKDVDQFDLIVSGVPYDLAVTPPQVPDSGRVEFEQHHPTWRGSAALGLGVAETHSNT